MNKPLKIVELTFLPRESRELERCKGTDYWYVFGWSSVFARRLAENIRIWILKTGGQILK